jgi:hypothetical protein
MKVSFEIPVSGIMKLKGHQDYDFTLAHMALTNEHYRMSYGEGNVMDNGMYELDSPMSVQDLMRAVKLIKPGVMISPDFPTERRMTLEAHKICVKMFDCEVAGVICGENLEDRVQCYEDYLKLGTNIICVPFRYMRREFMIAIKEAGLLMTKPDTEIWYHYLGLVDMSELQFLLDLNLPWCSIDTSKPIKAAIHDKNIYDDLRGLGKIDLMMDMDERLIDKCVFQMERFRDICHGRA